MTDLFEEPHPDSEDGRMLQLLNAAEAGDLAAVQRLLDSGLSANAEDSLDRRTALHLAAEKGHLEVVRCLLQCGANVSAVNQAISTITVLTQLRDLNALTNALTRPRQPITYQFGNTALHWAVAGGFLDVAELLVTEGEAPLNVANEYTLMTPLHWAAADGNTEMVQLLLRKGANIEAKSAAGYTALHDAAQYGRTAVVKQLLWHGAMRAVEGKDGRTPHDLATGGEGVDSAGVVALLNGMPQQLRQAAFEGQFDKTLAILQTPGVTVNDEDEESLNTALHYAASGGHHSIVQLLLEHGGDPNVQNRALATPAHLAAGNSHSHVVCTLLDTGRLRVGVCDGNGDSLLLLAARMQAVDLVTRLVHAGADHTVANKRNETAFFFAAKYGDVPMVEMFLGKGVDLEVADHEGHTALAIAATNGHHRIVDMLLHAGAHVETRNAQKNTPLMLAAARGHVSTVAALLAGRASMEAKGQHGLTAHGHASANGHSKVATQLDNWAANKAKADAQTAKTGKHGRK